MELKKDTILSIPKGYKHTEIGVIPKDWEIKPIKSISDVKSGKRLPKGNTLQDIKTKHPYIRVADMFLGGVSTDEIKYVPEEIYPIIKNYRIFKDDIFISVAGTLGIVGKIPNRLDGANLTENANRLTNIKCYRDFLLYFLMSDLIQKRIESERTLGAQPKLALTRIRNFQITLPPTLQEQKAIATALSDTDELINTLKTLIAKKKAIKQGTMQELLTGKKRLQGFTGDWEIKKLGKLGKTLSGLSGKTKEDFDEGNYPYITFLNVMNNVKIDTSIFGYVHIKSGEAQNTFLKGDLFFNTSSETPQEVGMCAVLLENIENLYLNSFCFGYRLFEKSEIDGLFLSYLINSGVGRKLFEALAQGATRYNLSKSNFSKVEIFVPDYKEQQAIAQILSDMDTEIEALQTRLQKTQHLKQGMMQELLTGKTRLLSNVETRLLSDVEIPIAAEPQAKYGH